MPSAAGSRATPDHGNLLMLGIETSCDDTAAAVVRGDGEILSQVVSSQEDLLVRWGGVAPKMAEEAHLLAIDRVVQKALDNANVSESDLSAVAVTVGPGLSLCLRVGVHKARKIAKSFHLPIVGVHHMEAQALVSMRQHKDCNFSYAGLKTQVRLAIESRNISTDDIPISSATKDDRQIRANIAASFQVVSGGVASNQYVKNSFESDLLRRMAYSSYALHQGFALTMADLMILLLLMKPDDFAGNVTNKYAQLIELNKTKFTIKHRKLFCFL
uniref:N(6)-L-threonylcarbamoyladenine synthase n=1 Tax=Oryza rufipogon TaxID=4529 RepID=A0A0E0MV20_ORYRU